MFVGVDERRSRGKRSEAGFRHQVKKRNVEEVK